MIHQHQLKANNVFKQQTKSIPFIFFIHLVVKFIRQSKNAMSFLKISAGLPPGYLS